MNTFATLNVMSIPMVAKIIDGNMYAQYMAPCGAMANRRGAMIHEIPEMMINTVPGNRCRTNPPKVEMRQPPNAIGTYQATTWRGEADMTCSI